MTIVPFWKQTFDFKFFLCLNFFIKDTHRRVQCRLLESWRWFPGPHVLQHFWREPWPTPRVCAIWGVALWYSRGEIRDEGATEQNSKARLDTEKPVKPALGFCPRPGLPLSSRNFLRLRTCCRTGKWRNGRGMVSEFLLSLKCASSDEHDIVHLDQGEEPTPNFRTFHYCSIIFISRKQ